MKHYDLLVIGGVAAGMSAASQARRANKDMSIAVMEKDNYVSYGACGMPYLIDDLVDDENKLIAIDKNKFINERNIQIFTDSSAGKIDFDKKQVEVKHKDRAETYTYGKLVIATGAVAVMPPVKGLDYPNIFLLRDLNQGITIKNYIRANNPSKGVIIGGGSIGLEMAETLRTLGIETIMLEKMDDIALAFDKEIRDIIRKELTKNDVAVKSNVNINEVIKDNNKLTVKLDDESIGCDFIIVSAGIKPNTGFLKGTGLKMTDRGAIIVNEKSETNIPDVYSAGDCATVKHLLLSEDVYFPLGTTSNKQGRVAGLQAAGVKTEVFKGVIGSQLIKMFDLELGKTGLSETEAEKNGIKAKSSGVDGRSRAGYYPGAKSIFVKLTVNTGTGELIGAQIAGTDQAAQRTNVAAGAIAAKWDPLLVAAQSLVKR